MSRTSVDSQPRPLYGEKSVRGCVNNMDKKKNTILIDVDSYCYDNVIIIDVPDSVPCTNKFRRLDERGKAQATTNVIDIDDEDDDETRDDKQSGDGVKNKTSSHAEASTSRNFSRAGDGATEKGKHAQEKVTPVRLSKCKRTYSGKGFGTNHYGLDTDSEAEGDASDSDAFPDCEVMVDSSGRVQKQWEKAFFKRCKDMNKGDSGVGNNCSTSKGKDLNQGQQFETMVDSSGRIQKQWEEAFFKRCKDKNKGDSGVGNNYSTSKCKDLNQGQQFETEGESRRTGKGPFSSDTHKSETSNIYKAPSFRMNVETEADAHPRSDLRDKDSPLVQPNLNEQKHNEPENSKKNMDAGQKNSASHNPNHQEKSEAEEVRRTSAAFTGTTTSTFKANTTPGLKSAFPPKATTSPAFTGTTSTATTTPSFTATPTPAPTATATDPSTAFIRKCQKVVESGAVAGSSDPKNIRNGTTRGNNKKNSFSKPAEIKQDDKLQSSEKEGSKDESCQNEDESRVLSEREKLKETDEYKKAMDEEWASRQKSLQIQAEEAQRQKQLRKRKKAENSRLSDIKKRQKKRLDEIRTSQKKDEETMNLKEVIRAEVRKDLQKLELSCKNMAFLLHSLGVSVTGWPNPQPQEVQAAYKKALLTFHPDRASRLDIRKQVEAEERFKLVNRLKEKFSPTL